MLTPNQNKIAEFLEKYSSSLIATRGGLEEKHRHTILSITEGFKSQDLCYSIINLKSQTIEWSYGFNRYLGYPDHTIINQPMETMDDMIHPFVRAIDRLYTAAILNLNSLENGLKIGPQTTYNINVPLMKRNGIYMMVKRISVPLGFDKMNRLLSILNIYSVTTPYHTQALRPRLFDDSKRVKGFLPKLYQKAAEFIPNVEVNFTPAEFRYIDEYIKVAGFDHHLNHKFMIAKELGIDMYKTTGVMEHNIKKKICRLFKYPHAYISQKNDEHSKNTIMCMPDFRSFKEGIHFLDKSGIYHVLKNICYKKV